MVSAQLLDPAPARPVGAVRRGPRPGGRDEAPDHVMVQVGRLAGRSGDFVHVDTHERGVYFPAWRDSGFLPDFAGCRLGGVVVVGLDVAPGLQPPPETLVEDQEDVGSLGGKNHAARGYVPGSVIPAIQGSCRLDQQRQGALAAGARTRVLPGIEAGYDALEGAKR